MLVNTLAQIVSRRDFLPFGEEIVPDAANLRTDAALKYNGDGVRQKFTGYQKDDESGLDFAEARMYENRHGRFTAIDPLLASGKSVNPQTFNRYVYVLNNPLAFTDPDGLQVGVQKGKVYINNQTGQVGIFPGKVRTGFVPLDRNITGTTTIKGVVHHMSATPTGWTIGDRVDDIRFIIPSTPKAKSYASALAEVVNYGVDSGIKGILKGVGNTPAILWNGATNALAQFGTGGWYTRSNPFAVPLPFAYNNPLEASYGSASSTGTGIGFGLGGSAIMAARSGTLSIVPETQIFRFSQNFVRSDGMFSKEGSFSGKSIMGVADDLRSGAMSVQNVPVGYVQRGSFSLIDNTRSSIALQEAGIPMNQWNLVNRTGQTFFENSVTTKLANNGLTNAGTNTVRFGKCFYTCQ